jgi:transposase InsO family protein
MILGLIDEAMSAGAREAPACKLLGIHVRTLQRWRAEGIGEDLRTGPNSTPPNKLSADERAQILALANAPEYRELGPKQIVARLADRGVYVASESSFYRVLRAEGQMKHRGPTRAPSKSSRPKELVATGPNQVWSWDITYLPTPVRGYFFYLYMVIDVWSRKIVGRAIHLEESAEHSSALISEACRRENVDKGQLTLHADNGGPMKGSALLATLLALGVASSFSRPRVSNDNAFIESNFRTMKYRPNYPRKPFASLQAAIDWVDAFIAWYNTEHRHSGIRFVTPEQRHDGVDTRLLARRHSLYEAAKKRNPLRWTGNTRDWTPIEVVRLNPTQIQITA